MILFKKEKDGTKRILTIFGVKITYHKKVPGYVGRRQAPLEAADGSLKARELFFRQLRFDLVFKYIYLKYHYRFGKKTDYFLNLYLEHLRVFNNFTEYDDSYESPKLTPDDFVIRFDALWKSLSEHGFDAGKSLIPIDENNQIVNGSHRCAACALLNLNVKVEKHPSVKIQSYREFLANGLSPELADYAALEFVKANPNAYIVNLQSVTSPSTDGQVEEILNRYGFIYYKKSVQMTYNGYVNLKKLSYGMDNWKRDSWIGTVEDEYYAAQEHTKKSRGDGSNPLRVYVFVCGSLEDVVKAKLEIREIYKIDNYSVHINDTHEEAIDLAEIYFNKNSLYVINNRNFALDPDIDEHVHKLKILAKDNDIDLDDICVAGSGPLSVLGIREVSDLDFLYCGEKSFEGNKKSISYHRSELKYYPHDQVEIIQNPKYHFYYRRVKFITPQVLLEFKRNRNEHPKDIEDVKMLSSYLSGAPLPMIERKSRNKFKLVKKIKRGRERTLVILGVKIRYKKQRGK